MSVLIFLLPAAMMCAGLDQAAVATNHATRGCAAAATDQALSTSVPAMLQG
jgi:hypothetical protein